MELHEYRSQIDQIDQELVRLFKQRMFLSQKIGDYKKERGLPIFVPEREAEKLEALEARVTPQLRPYLQELYATIFSLSRKYQEEQP